MVKKEADNKGQEQNKFSDMKKKVMDMVSDFLLGSVKSSIKEVSDDFVIKLRKTLIDFGKTTIQYIFIGIIMFLGFIYLIFSFVLLTKEYLKVSTGISLLIWAFILILFGFLYSIFLSSKKKDKDWRN
ncbi:MAG: hypothetical protein ACQER9_02530 [Nanobdellota archaeon]